MRQVVDPQAEILLAQSYSPYGKMLSSVGDFETVYSYTGEMTDGTGLVNLRARFYDPGTGRFVSRDTWAGDYNNPVTMNKWVYANGNPIIYSDPSGHCYTNPNIFSKGYWSRFWESPFLGPCSTYTPSSNNTPTCTVTPNPSPTPTPTPTTPPTPTPGNWEDLGDFSITHYVTAREDDPYYKTHGDFKGWADQTGFLNGLDQNKKYNLNWAYGGDRDVLFQGQGLSRFGEYITKDWNKSTNEKVFFIYGKGGMYGPPRDWETIATGDSRLKPHDWVRISAYPNKGPFEVLDTGEQVGAKHIDIFIGDKTIGEANSLGNLSSSVSVLR